MVSRSPQESTRPEVDELGYPVNPLPKEPITDFLAAELFLSHQLLASDAKDLQEQGAPKPAAGAL